LICNFITTKILGEINKNNMSIDEIFIRPNHIIELVNLLDNKKISSDQAKKIFSLMMEEKLSPIELAKKYDMEVIEDSSLIDSLVDEVVSENQKAIEDYHNGRTKMLDYLVGQVMKKSKGKANPLEAKSKMLEKIQ
jgi:aspartyl-tRNA(Asn)/glutamyl-tRNA(Gln) amidotransferase subunit B